MAAAAATALLSGLCIAAPPSATRASTLLEVGGGSDLVPAQFIDGGERPFYGLSSGIDRGARRFGYDHAPAPYYGYRPYRPRVVMPTPVRPLAPPRAGMAAPEPWTAQWYAYCADKYVSFDRSTGGFTTYAGKRRFCR